LVFVFLITHQFHLLNLRISISFLAFPLALFLCCCLFLLWSAFLFALRRHFCFFSLPLCLLVWPSHFLTLLFVCLLFALSLIVTSNLTLSLPLLPSLFLFWPWQNFLQNEIVFVLTISLKLNYFYYSDRIRRTKGEKVSLPFLPLPHFTHFPPPCDPFSTHSTLKQKLGVCFLQLTNKLIALLIDLVGFQ